MMNRPLSRKSNLLVQDLVNETLIYDLDSNRALCLNKTSGLVWQFCDGEKSIAEISRLMSIELKSSVSEDFVWLALDGLKKEGLLANGDEISRQFKGMSRRAVVRKVGLASMVALPIIANLTAPQATAAVSGCPQAPNICQTFVINSGNCQLQNLPNGCVGTGHLLCSNGNIIVSSLCP